ncbi:MAG: hypothetical protein LBR08_01860 [Bacteroidales bacterium]|jgi:hypothetical protein|nr:hypothetical protein [Bacteroidales bacterium]
MKTVKKETDLKNSLLYSSVNTLLRDRLHEIQKQIKEAAYERKYHKLIKKIRCRCAYTPYVKQHIQWRIDIELREVVCDEHGEPHGAGSFSSMEAVAGLLYYNPGKIYNSFVKNHHEPAEKNSKNEIIIKFGEINDREIVEKIMSETLISLSFPPFKPQ